VAKRPAEKEGENVMPVETSEAVQKGTPNPENEPSFVRKKPDDTEAKAESYLNRLKYLQADFDNYRKRMAKSLEEISSLEQERIICKFLGVKDDLERALKVAEEGSDAASIREGLMIILKNVNSILADENVEEVKAVGRLFDPEKHEAVGSVNRSDCEENTVANELRKGYVLQGRVIRPSLVKVTRKAKVVEEIGGSEGEE